MHWITWVIWASLFASVLIVIWGIRDVLSYSVEEFRAARRTRWAWIAAQIVLGPLVTLLWVGTARFDVRDPSRLDEAHLSQLDAER